MFVDGGSGENGMISRNPWEGSLGEKTEKGGLAREKQFSPPGKIVGDRGKKRGGEDLLERPVESRPRGAVLAGQPKRARTRGRYSEGGLDAESKEREKSSRETKRREGREIRS